ncbi:MAG: FHA domain-containing protein [Phycisphaerae bacterium]
MSERSIPELPKHAISVSLRAPEIDGVSPHTIRKPVTIVGSRRDCDFPISHPEVSKVHCAVVHTGATVFVCDLRSRTGTYVNEQFANLSELVPGVALRTGTVSIDVAFGTAHDSQSAWASALSPTPLRLFSPTTGEERSIEYAAAVIGRRATCDVVVDHPDISLAHALVFFLDGKPAICDLGSRSGTKINSQNVLLSWLADGDKVSLGGFEWVVRWEGPIGFVPPVDSNNGRLDARTEAQTSADPSPVTAFAPIEQDRAEFNAAMSPVAPSGTSSPNALVPPATELELQIPVIDFASISPADFANISKTVAGLEAALKRAQQLIEVRAAELRRRELLFAKRELELRAREKKMEAREAGDRAATAQIEQFKVALHLAQSWFQDEGDREAADQSTEKKIPRARKSAPVGNGLFQNAMVHSGGLKIGANGNGHPAGSRSTSRFN